MEIIITLDQQPYRAKLVDNPTAQQLYQLLPLELNLEDFANEKIASLSHKLTTQQASARYQGKANDITYYAPWGNLALFYGDGPNASGLIYLGHFQQDISEILPKAKTIRIEKVE